MNEPTTDSKVEGFERGVILRVSRSMYLLLSALASIVAILGVLGITYALLPTMRGADPEEPIPPEPPAVSLDDVMKAVQEAEPEPSEVTVASLRSESDEPDPDAIRAQRFNDLATALGSLFDKTRYPWLSETENYCKSAGYYGCYSYGTRIVRKGVVESVNASLSQAPRDQQVDILQALVDVASVVGTGAGASERDDIRFVAVGATLDLIAAADGVSAAPVSALRDALAGGGSPIGLDAARDVLLATLKIRKRGRDQALLSVWMRAAPRLRGAFGKDAEGESNQVDGLAATWDALQGTVTTLADQRLAAIEAIAMQAEEASRPEIVRAYGTLVRDRSAAAQAAYAQAIDERASAIAALDATAEATRTKKSEVLYQSAAVVASALGALAVLGLFLALLAVERNTRALREVLGRIDGR